MNDLFPYTGCPEKKAQFGTQKNALLQTAFSAILPTGSVMHYYCIPCFYKI